MTFREFLQLDELEGQYGPVKAHAGPLQLIKTQSKMAKMPSSSNAIKRIVSGGAGPARPAKISSVKGPMTHPTFLK